MSNYKYPTPQLLFKAICDTIREKTGSTDKIAHQDIPDSIDNILTEEEYILAIQNLYNIINEEVTEINDANISRIDNYKFCNCENLTIINLPKCTTIGNQTFGHCTNLTTVNLPKCISIEVYAFECCTNLTTIDLPKCTTIGGSAFSRCTNLTTVNLPKCTSIGDMVFNECTNLTTIILSNNKVVTLKHTNAFSGSSIANGTGYIYVPDNLVDSYKSGTNWSTYANQIKPISELSN